ncbi:helix-turn-helix domain-containing protein [Pacificimonas flava]|uniref:Transcriptional regulator, AraC family n=1 Tax=Pacificimonas flava TaxID=1234595 RepID=M2SDX1_9SPHN|nr:helix-turn-helix domain-containing protein [Pacificimonas flava]EMD83560.1 transcriptional regulator, AraC family [Pacificimonas flava]MBB5278889.1 AraC-like DNA-binding protein [Pacificimonas flava]
MIEMHFYLPARDLRAYLSSYYVLEYDLLRLDDIIQAEQSNIRFGLAGQYRMSVADRSGLYDGAVLFGHRTRPLIMTAFGPGKVLGAGLLPLGFETMFGMSADEMADRITPLPDLVGRPAEDAVDCMRGARSDAELTGCADMLFRRLAVRPARGARFQAAAERWLTMSEAPQVDDLVAACDMSARQTERLCHQYFGTSPKTLSRKSRVLRAAMRLRLNPGMRWVDAAGEAFYDQSHFIREFSAFTGMTPARYAATKSDLMEQSFRRRNEHRLIPPLSLLS